MKLKITNKSSKQKVWKFKNFPNQYVQKKIKTAIIQNTIFKNLWGSVKALVKENYSYKCFNAK